MSILLLIMNNNIIRNVKSCFPIFKKKINGKRLSYLDNAAMTQVPNVVIKSLSNFYSNMNANIHRGAYYLSEVATESYESVRYKISKFIGADFPCECIFVKSTTEGINLVANSFLRPLLKAGDEILISQMEHHSNIVPWYLLSKEFNVKLKIIPILKTGDLDYSKIDTLLTSNTKLLAVTHISNSLGTINNLKYIIDLAHFKNIPVLVDGAQSLSNTHINVNTINCDFFVFSSHKVFGPNGLGILYAKKHFLNNMIPYQGGGDMIKYVSFSNISWNDIPYKFEAGTPPIANVISFGSSIDFLNNIDLKFLFDYKKNLFDYACERLSKIPGVVFVGNPNNRTEILSFLVDNIHSHDLGTVANHYGVSVRTGHHCSMPVMEFYGISSTVRLSLSFYNVKKDIDTLVEAILAAKKIFS